MHGLGLYERMASPVVLSRTLAISHGNLHWRVSVSRLSVPAVHQRRGIWYEVYPTPREGEGWQHPHGSSSVGEYYSRTGGASPNPSAQLCEQWPVGGQSRSSRRLTMLVCEGKPLGRVRCILCRTFH